MKSPLLGTKHINGEDVGFYVSLNAAVKFCSRITLTEDDLDTLYIVFSDGLYYIFRYISNARKFIGDYGGEMVCRIDRENLFVPKTH